MKKLITIILIMVMILPAAALADQDPVVGTWYTYTGVVEDPEIRKQAYYELSTFTFTEDGNVFASTYDISAEGITTAKDYKVIGLWTNENGHYYVNIGMTGAVEVSFDNDDMFFPVSSYSLRIRKLEPVNFALDMHK